MNKSVNRVSSLICFLLCLYLFPLSSESIDLEGSKPIEYSSLVFDEIPGSYVQYRDTRFGKTVYIGLCALGGNELALRYFEPETKTELLVLQTIYTTGDPSVPSSLQIENGSIELIRGDFAESDATKSFLPMINNWLNAWLHSRSRLVDMPEYTFEENGIYNFQYWIPILQMKSLDADIMLVSAGVVTSGIDPVFFEYAGEAVVSVGPELHLVSTDVHTVMLDELSVPLDSNWMLEEDGVYRIAQVTKQDAFFSVETLDMGEYTNSDTFDLIKLYLLYCEGTLLPDSLRLFVSDNNPCVFYRVYDSETHVISVQYKMFVPRDETFLSVVSMGVIESVYNDNKELFDTILF